MKKNNKYTYVQAASTTYQGARTYDVHGIRLPSVTTILAKTKDQAYLTNWKNKVGHEEAERIKNLSSKRGTAMHKFIEKYIQESGYEDLTEIGVEAKPMAEKIIESGLKPISHYYGSEITLYYPGLYAGATDLVCMHNDMETIVDFKQANRPKKEEWIEDYLDEKGEPEKIEKPAEEKIEVEQVPQDKTYENERETKLEKKEEKDELKEYSEGVQKRIAKLTRKMREFGSFAKVV